MQPLLQSILEHFCHFVRNLYPLAVPSTPPTPCPYPKQLPICFWSLYVYLFQTFQMLGILWHVVFCDQFLSVSILFSRFIRIIFTTEWYFIVWSDHILITGSSADGHLGFPSLGYCEQGCQEYLPTGFLMDLCFHFCQQSFNPTWWGDQREWERQMREREKLRQRDIPQPHCHTETRGDTKREMDIQVDAVIRTQTDTGETSTWKQRLSKSAGDTQHRRGKADSSLGTARRSLFLCSSGASDPWSTDSVWLSKTGFSAYPEASPMDFQLFGEICFKTPGPLSSFGKRRLQSGPWLSGAMGVWGRSPPGQELNIPRSKYQLQGLGQWPGSTRLSFPIWKMGI